jgi:hypothetical protein
MFESLMTTYPIILLKASSSFVVLRWQIAVDSDPKRIEGGIDKGCLCIFQFKDYKARNRGVHAILWHVLCSRKLKYHFLSLNQNKTDFS